MFQSLKVDLLMNKRKDSSAAGLRLRTSLCYNQSLERMTLAVFQVEGVQVSWLHSIRRGSRLVGYIVAGGGPG